MTQIEKLNLLIEGVNLSEDHRYLEPLNEKRLLEIYEALYGKELLDIIIKSNDPNYPHLRIWNTKLKEEMDEANFSIFELKKIIDRIEPYYYKNWMLVNLIDKVLEKKNISFAETIISELEDNESGPSQFVGQRKLLKYYAENNNIIDFKSKLKLSKPSKSPISEIHMYKDLMIENYSKKNGVEKGITLCNEKIFGAKFCLATVKWKVHQIELIEIEEILEKYQSFFIVEEFAKIKLFVLHFHNRKPTIISETDFKKVIDDIMLIDKNMKWGDGRMRDALLNDLGSSTFDIKQINECKKNIISPFYKRELNYHLKNIKAK